MNKEHIGCHIIHREMVGSTNDELKQLAKEGASHGTVLYADYQTMGRGRMGRSWDSPAGDNIYLSILLRPEIDPFRASMLTLVTALAVADSLEEILTQEEGQGSGETEADFHVEESIQIKWPNDLVLHRKKVCGILTEMSGSMEGIEYVVVGIGINVNREDFPEEIAHMASSVQLPLMAEVHPGQHPATQEKTGKEWVIDRLLFHFEERYNTFLKEANMTPFLWEYNKRLAGRNQKVQILSRGANRIGTAEGIDEMGALIVTDETGKKEKIISGEVSVRGLYGYSD